jgi:SAM-dependent methyltransferase
MARGDGADPYGPVSNEYARYRPVYPQSLFDWLAGTAPSNDLAWDCGCGSGQATLGLAGKFTHVVGTDPSPAQLGLAPRHPNIDYRIGREANSGLSPESASVVTAAQAAHWFDLPAFYHEASRVLAPDGVLAIWSYGPPSVSRDIDGPLDWFRLERVGRQWPPGREHVEDGYRRLPFPWPELNPPSLIIEADWDLARLLGYVRSWSAVARTIALEGRDPVPELEAVLGPHWGPSDSVRRISWSIALRAGRKPAATLF